MTEALLAIDGLSASQGDRSVLWSLDLRVAAGEIVAVLGANGAGKSTLLKTIMGLIPVRAGQIRFDRTDITAHAPEARARAGIGYVPEGRRVFPGLTVQDNLDVACHAGAAARAKRRARIEALFPRLAERRGQKAWSLSGGEQQMLAIGRALMGAPRLLLLDEPSLGLAPRLMAELFASLAQIRASGTAILLAEQSAAQALKIADRAYGLGLGRVVASGAAASLAADPGLAAVLAGLVPKS
ncbi:MAG: ABC transporter ATP-binding protein [Alphaproteobacteria bacterium]